MEKYAFNHDTNELTTAMGISEERFDEIVKAIRHAQVDGDNVLDTIEITLNKLDPKDIVEAMFIGYSIAKCYEAEANPMLRMLHSMRKRMNDE